LEINSCDEVNWWFVYYRHWVSYWRQHSC